MAAIEPITHAWELPPGAVCLTPTGWRAERYEVIVQLQGGATLEQTVEALWNQHKGLLGDGSLSFKRLSAEPHPRGFLVFTPAE